MTMQVNARVPDEVGAALDRWASELGLERGALARDIIAEAVEARREGRASFERPELPGPADLQRLVARLDGQTTELDRVLRQNAKRDAELARQARDDTQGVSGARDAIVADVVAHMRAALEAVHGELVRTREELAALLGRLPQLAAVQETLEQVLEASRQPRVANTYDFGLGQWPSRTLALAGLVTVLLSVGLFYVVAMVLPAQMLAVRSANLLLGGGDQAICALVDHRYSTDSCKTRVHGRDVGVTLDVPGPKGKGER